MSKRFPPKGDNQPDFFAAVFTDIPVRDQRETMERPFFSLAKKPRITPIEYEVGPVMVRVSPNREHGMATIWDADVLIWAATQITEALDRGRNPGRTIQFHPYNLLKSVRRGTSGRDYERLRAALRRLASTYVETNIRTMGRQRKTTGFHWLEDWSEMVNEESGETLGMIITLPNWLYQGIIMDGGVLTINEDYFLLTGGVERWLYRVARKHAGTQDCGWPFTMRQLFRKSGSSARFSDFAIDVRKLVEENKLPEYSMTLTRNGDGEEVVHFIARSRLDITDPGYEGPRNPRRRVTSGMGEKGIRFAADTGN